MSSLLAQAVAALISSSSWLPVVSHRRHPRPDPAPVHRHPKPDPPPLQSALASYYAEHGGGACGVDDVQRGYRFASLFLACGARIRICHSGCVTATMADHGPYVAGRTFDLNVNLRSAIGCGDLCSVRWRRL